LASQELIDYINNEFAGGKTKEAIISELLSSGWQQNDIDDAMGSIDTTAQSPQSSQPQPTQPTQSTDKLQAPQMPQTEQTVSEQPKKSSILLKLIPVFILIPILIAVAVFFIFFYSSCPKFMIEPGQFDSVVIGHSWDNERNIPDVIDLSMGFSSGNIFLDSSWQNYLQSYDFGKYQFVSASTNDYRCFKGSESMDQNSDYNYCTFKLKDEEDQEKVMWVVLEIMNKAPIEAMLSSYSDFGPIQWTLANVNFVDSYCGEPDFVLSSEQKDQINPKIKLFSPGEVKFDYEVWPTTVNISILNGYGADINIKRLQLDTCEKTFQNELLNDGTKNLYILEDCNPGVPGNDFTSSVVLTFSALNQDSETITDEISTIILEPVVEEEELFIFPEPCVNLTTCKGVVAKKGGPLSAASSETGYGLTWMNYNPSLGKSYLYFTSLDNSGEKVSNERIILEVVGQAKKPSIVWTSTGYSILWPLKDQLYFLSLDSEGSQIHEAKTIKALGEVSEAELSWSDDGYGMIWNEQGSKSTFMMLDLEGGPIGESIVLGEKSSNPSITWIGDEYGVAWMESSAIDKRIFFSRIVKDEGIISTIKLQSKEPFCDDPDLSWANSRYGILYHCFVNDSLKNEEIFFMRIHSQGGRADLITLDQGMATISNGLILNHHVKEPSVILTEDYYGAAYIDNRDGNEEIYFAPIDDYTGTMKEDEVRITQTDGNSANPVILRTDLEYALIWTEQYGDFTHIYFTNI